MRLPSFSSDCKHKSQKRLRERENEQKSTKTHRGERINKESLAFLDTKDYIALSASNVMMSPAQHAVTAGSEVKLGHKRADISAHWSLRFLSANKKHTRDELVAEREKKSGRG